MQHPIRGKYKRRTVNMKMISVCQINRLTWAFLHVKSHLHDHQRFIACIRWHSSLYIYCKLAGKLVQRKFENRVARRILHSDIIPRTAHRNLAILWRYLGLSNTRPYICIFVSLIKRRLFGCIGKTNVWESYLLTFLSNFLVFSAYLHRPSKWYACQFCYYTSKFVANKSI